MPATLLLAVAVVLRLANDAGPRGALTIYNLAWTVFLVPWAVLAVPIATSAFPRLSVHAADRDDDAYRRTAAQSTRVWQAATQRRVAGAQTWPTGQVRTAATQRWATRSQI